MCPGKGKKALADGQEPVELDRSCVRPLGRPARPGLVILHFITGVIRRVEGASTRCQLSKVGFSLGDPVHDEKAVGLRMRSFMEGFYARYPLLLDVPLLLDFGHAGPRGACLECGSGL